MKAHSALIRVVQGKDYQSSLGKIRTIHEKIIIEWATLKQRLFSFKMIEGNFMEEQLEQLSKVIDYLENIDVGLEDTDKAFLLLNAIAKSFEHFKDVTIYGRENTIVTRTETSVRFSFPK